MPTVDFIEYIESLAATSIPGVVHDFGMEPPQSLSTAQLPAKWLRLARTNRSRFAFDVSGMDAHGTGLMTTEVVIAYNPVIQGLPEPNFRETVTLVDEVTKTIVKSPAVDAMSWAEVSCRVAIIPVAELNYWVVIAEVTARG